MIRRKLLNLLLSFEQQFTFLGADVDKLKVKEGGVPGVGAALRLPTHLKQQTIGLKTDFRRFIEVLFRHLPSVTPVTQCKLNQGSRKEVLILTLTLDLPCFSALWRKQGIREIKVCKKCPKVNPYCDAIFDPILFKPFLDGAK